MGRNTKRKAFRQRVLAASLPSQKVRHRKSAVTEMKDLSKALERRHIARMAAEPARIQASLIAARCCHIRCYEIGQALLKLSDAADERIPAEYVKAGFKNHPAREVFLSEPTLSKVRLWGQELHELGGFQAMQLATDCIPYWDWREIDYALDGIGEWRC